MERPPSEFVECRSPPFYYRSIAVHRTPSSQGIIISLNESIEETYVVRCEEPREVGLAAALKEGGLTRWEGHELKGGGKRQTVATDVSVMLL
jgi:hypothetical protein